MLCATTAKVSDYGNSANTVNSKKRRTSFFEVTFYWLIGKFSLSSFIRLHRLDLHPITFKKKSDNALDETIEHDENMKNTERS